MGAWPIPITSWQETGYVSPSSAKERSLTDFLFAHAIETLRDLIHFQGDFHEAKMFLVDLRGNLSLHFGLHDVEDGKIHCHSGQGAGPAGVAVDHGLRIQLSAVRVGRSQNDDQVISAIFVGRLLDVRLTLRVKGAGSRSDKTLGED
jgi:hypothetical protein